MAYDLKQTSMFISMILRHKPEEIGISLDEHGWANTNELIAGINAAGNYCLTMKKLEYIVNTDNKQRYSFNSDKTLIRANQGHSIPVDVELEEIIPPEYVYHGTGVKYVESIREQGLIPKSRLYVHLSSTKEIAITVGARHGEPHVFLVHAKAMYDKGYKFYKSINGVILTKYVPINFLEDLLEE